MGLRDHRVAYHLQRGLMESLEEVLECQAKSGQCYGNHLWRRVEKEDRVHLKNVHLRNVLFRSANLKIALPKNECFIALLRKIDLCGQHVVMNVFICLARFLPRTLYKTH